jgi:hypothetical protein
MPYEEALLHAEIGRRARPGSPEARDHLAQARDLFERVQAGADASRLAQRGPVVSDPRSVAASLDAER